MRSATILFLASLLTGFCPAAAAQGLAPAAAASPWDAYQADMITALRDSADPQDQVWAILIAQLQQDTDPDAPARWQGVADSLPEDAAVQFLVHTRVRDADPALAAATLERLHRLEPDNAAVWLEDVATAARERDAATVETALAGMARSAFFDDHMADWLGRERDMRRRFPAPPAVLEAIRAKHPGMPADEMAVMPTNMATATVLSVAPYQALIRACTIDAASGLHRGREPDCARVGRLLAGGPNLIANHIGAAILRASGTWTEADARAAREHAWLVASWSGTLTRAETAMTTAQFLDDWISTGSEIQAVRASLERAGMPLLPPADWEAPRAPFAPDALARQRERVADVIANPF